MIRIILLFLIFSIIGCKDQGIYVEDQCPIINVRFSPKGGITQSITESINGSNKNIHINAFSFTSAPIADSLIEASSRNIHIEVILDRENLSNENSVINKLHKNNITIFIDDKHAIAHNKVIIIDNKQVFTGSFNFSKGAEERNAENSVSIINKKIAETYLENWQSHREHSFLYDGD